MNSFQRLTITAIGVFMTIMATYGAEFILSGSVRENHTGDSLPYAVVTAVEGKNRFTVQTDSTGYYTLRLPVATYMVTAEFPGLESKKHKIRMDAADHILNFSLQSQGKWLREVMVTAREGDGLTSSSRIDRSAMEHLQPTSFTDLLELLPGNISQNPDMGKANTINLRETGTLGATGQKIQNEDYDISSLGTLFLVDGAPINGDANLQTVGTTSDTPSSARNITNKGVDMRSISTDNIESVEIVRGIPSAEYGNLTSGLVKINRIKSATPFTARFKADEYSKLFSAGKGVALGSHEHTLNLDITYLDSKTDPRNNLENYKRITGSARMFLKFQKDRFGVNWNIGGDYTGSFDNAKADPDLNFNKIDEYKSSYNRVSFTSDLDISLFSQAFFTNFSINTSASYQLDRLERHKKVAPQRASIAPTTMEPGVHPGEYLLGEYIADYLSDGRPLNIFVKAKASGLRSIRNLTNRYMIGGEWTLSKNFGHGQVYDLRRPLSASWTSRPRDFSEIPALNVLSFFIENESILPVGANIFTLRLGLRSIQIPGLDRRYYLANRPYLDPRVNLQWKTEDISTKEGPLSFSVSGGAGLTTKMPTLDYLYPQEYYADIIQLNYYDTEKPREHSLVSLRTYINDATNYDLRAARNFKWEARFGIRWRGNSLSVTYFQENMNSGFRYTPVFSPYYYRKYDASGVVSTHLTSPPVLDNLPYADQNVLRSYRRASNGTRIFKRGIEFIASTERWKTLMSKLTVSGAWFKTTYSNSQMLYSSITDVVNGQAVSDKYVGLYNYRDGRVTEQVNTNFMVDTQISRWGLVFTTTLQCMWWVKTTSIPMEGRPVAYLCADDSQLHPYDQAASEDAVLCHLVKTYNDDIFRTVRIPFAAYLNLKATKSIGRHIRIALFVNRIIDWLPDYRANGLLIRRASNAYFGMELNLSI